MLYRHSGDGETATGVSDSTPEESETISREESGDVRGGEKHEIGTCLKAFFLKSHAIFHEACTLYNRPNCNLCRAASPQHDYSEC